VSADDEELLRRWRGGDAAALEELVRRCGEWIGARVRPRLGAELRAKIETQDVVQDALLEFLRYGPRVPIASMPELRALLLVIAENRIRDQHDWFHACRRAISREITASRAERIEAAGSATNPGERAARDELVDRVRLALELCEPDERRIVVLRALEGLGFDEIGRRVGLAPDAARMRYRRALPRLAARMAPLADTLDRERRARS
jgi:RNA polymerase sigma-70 factor (ECF subfamily)